MTPAESTPASNGEDRAVITRLEGDCFVSGWRRETPERHGVLSVTAAIGRARGAQAISLRILTLEAGASPAWANADDVHEVAFVVSGLGAVVIDGRSHRLEPDTAFHVAPGREVHVTAAAGEPLTLVSSRCPEPDRTIYGAPRAAASDVVGPQASLVRLADQPRETTADRWYTELIDARHGSPVTQFVGGIPPGRAPDHFHEYEEVLFVLAGDGRMWAGDRHCAIGPGSCVYLPRRQVHCVENTGDGELRLLGCFFPAGSPAVRYDA